MLNYSRRFLIVVAGVIAVAAGGAEVDGAGAASKIKQCGHVDGTVAVTVTKGNVTCKTARAVGRAWDRRTTVPNGYHSRPIGSTSALAATASARRAR